MGRIVVTGARGQLGAELVKLLLGEDVVALDHAALDVTDAALVLERMKDLAPSAIVNAAAWNKVDLAEDEPEAAFRANAFGPLALARAAAATDALLVHFSTDYVFGAPGDRPWREDDVPAPASVYACSKLAGESLVMAAAPKHLVIRTCGLYGLHGHGGKGTNFVETMLKLGAGGKPIRVVGDQVLAPTSTAELGRIVVRLLDLWETRPQDALVGLYHATAEGQCSWHEFAAEIFKQARLEPRLERTTTKAYGAKAARPAYSVLSTGRLGRLGLEFTSWKEGLSDYLVRRSLRG